MAIELISDLFNMPNIEGQFTAVKGGLADCIKSLTDLSSIIKGFKDTGLGDLAANSDKLTTAINGSAQATAKAKAAFDDLTNRISAQVAAANDNAAAVTKGAQAYDTLVKQSVRNKIALDDLNASQAQLKKTFESGVITLTEYETSLSDIKTAQQSLKTSNQDVTVTINRMTKEMQASAGSTDQLRQKLLLLQGQYDKLNESEKNSDAGQVLLKTIQAVDAATKGEEGKTGRFRLNVGNYEGAFATLKQEREQIKAELAEMDKARPNVQNVGVGFKTAAQRQSEGLSDQAHAGPTNFVGNGMGFDPNRYKEASTQLQALNVILEQEEKGFASVTMATRASERALQTMAAAGLEGTEGFEKLRESTVSAAQAQKEFTRQQKLLESEAPVLGAITLAAKGLAGAYAVGAGSVALFADGNEKVEKELNKLVAIMTILQGLQEAYELINKSGAASQAIKNALLRATSTATKEQAASTTAAAAANTELAASEAEVAAVAPEATAGIEAETIATGELAVATEGATVATISFGRAMAMTGIGALIAGVAVAIGYLISKIPDWIQGNKLTVKEQENLAEVVKKSNDVLMQQANVIKDLDGVEKRYYENQLALSTAAGQNFYKQFALKKSIAEQEKELAKDQMDTLGGDNATQSRRIATIQNLRDQEAALLKIQKDAIEARRGLGPNADEWSKSEAQEKEDAAKADVENMEKQIEAQQGVYDGAKRAREDYFAAQQRLGQLELEQQKFTADEERKVIYETSKLAIEAQKDRNSKIMSDARSSSAQRIAAIKSDRDQEIKAAQVDRNNLDPNATVRETEIADAKLNAVRSQANRDFNQKTREENRKEYERNRDAALEIYKTQLNQQIQAAQDIESGHVNNPDPTQPAPHAQLAERLAALATEYSARRDLLNAQLKEDLDKEGQNAEEKKAIETKYDDDILNLFRNMHQEYAAMEEQARQESLRGWEVYYEKRKEQIDEHANDQLVSLNTSHEGAKKYTRDRTKIEDEAALKSAQNDVEKAERDRNGTQDGTEARIEANDRLSKSAEDLSEKLRKQREDNKKDIQDQVAEDLTNIESLGNSAVEVSEIGYNRQVKNLENLEKHQQRSYDLQKKQIEDTSGSQEQKALREKILDDQKAAQDEKNARKQRQLDIQKAKFDKDKAIMDIILNTAVQVAKNLDDPFLEIAIIAAGAAELATAIATPLPKYKGGTLNHPGGAAIVGDGGVAELILEPGKAARWSAATPSIESLLPHTKVIPPAEIERMMMSGMFVNQQGAIIQNGNSQLEKKLDRLSDTMIWQTQRLERAARNNRPKVINNIKIDSKFGEHIHKSVFK